MHTKKHIYHHGDVELHGYIAMDKHMDTPRPGVLVIHDWSGCNEFAQEKAELLAEMGYIGFAVDMYGEGRLGQSIEEKQSLMEPLIHNRQLLRDRIQAAFHALKQIEEAKISHIAAIGFCFGGLCALDLARSGVDLAGVVSFHGLLNKPVGISKETIKAKILALHGYDDPMVLPEQVLEFCQEMTQAQVDWQMHMYGQTKHAFTNPNANDEKLGTIYKEIAATRAWQAMAAFLDEIFS